MFENIKASFCLHIKSFVYKIERYLCFTKEELESIKDSVKVTKNHAEKYTKIEQEAPMLFNAIEKIENENIFLKNENNVLLKNGVYYKEMIGKIFIADTMKDEDEKKKLFKKLGFVFEYFEKNEKKF